MTKPILIIAALLLAGCSRGLYDPPKLTPDDPTRFKIIKDRNMNYSGFTRFYDTQTGREYIVRHQGGIIEVEATK